MREVHAGLYVGDETDELQLRNQPGWFFVHACKEPYHRQTLGYSGRAAPSTHPEYLIARRGHRLILNLVDAPSSRFFSTDIFDAALNFIHVSLAAGGKVLVHCNEGHSRGPSIGLLYLSAMARAIPNTSLEEAEAAFLDLYPRYAPGSGVRGFLVENWQRYHNK